MEHNIIDKLKISNHTSVRFSLQYETGFSFLVAPYTIVNVYSVYNEKSEHYNEILVLKINF